MMTLGLILLYIFWNSFTSSKKYSSAQVIIISNLFSDFDINNVEEIVQGFQIDGFEIELLIV